MPRKSSKATGRRTPYDDSGAGRKGRVNPKKKATKSTERKASRAAGRRKR